MEHYQRKRITNILENLTSLEISYMQEYGGHIDYNSYDTYKTYLDSYFIKKHHLAGVYWPQHPSRITKTLQDYPVLDDQFLFLTGHNIAFGKQISFPSDFLHSMNYYNCLYLLSGKVEITFETHVFSLDPGDLFFIAPGGQCAINSETGAVSIHMMIRRNFIKQNYSMLVSSNLSAFHFFNESLQADAGPLFLHFKMGDNRNIQEHFLDGFAEYLWPDFYSNTLIQNHVQMIFSYLLLCPLEDINSNVFISTTEKNFHLIEEYLKNNYPTATLSSTAAQIHFSKQHICRIVKEYTGNTFLDLLTKIRIEKVKSYLSELCIGSNGTESKLQSL